MEVVNSTALLLGHPQFQVSISDDVAFLYLYCVHKIEQEHCKATIPIDEWQNSQDVVNKFLAMDYLSLTAESQNELHEALLHWLEQRQTDYKTTLATYFKR